MVSKSSIYTTSTYTANCCHQGHYGWKIQRIRPLCSSGFDGPGSATVLGTPCVGTSCSEHGLLLLLLLEFSSPPSRGRSPVHKTIQNTFIMASLLLSASVKVHAHQTELMFSRVSSPNELILQHFLGLCATVLAVWPDGTTPLAYWAVAVWELTLWVSTCHTIHSDCHYMRFCSIDCIHLGNSSFYLFQVWFVLAAKFQPGLLLSNSWCLKAN